MSEGLKRREFLKVLGVSGAGAGMVGCNTEGVERLIPYVVPPEDITPGVATWYASVCGECSAGCGLWVRTREGRAVKLEGNPHHPTSRGGLCTRGHASLQGLYDPDRFTGPMLRQGGQLSAVSWDDAEARLAEAIQGAAGNVLFISGDTGPSLDALVDEFLAAVGGTRVRHEGLAEAPLREATRIAFGRDVVPTFDFGAAQFILSFGADFLETWRDPVGHARGFASASGVGENGSKAPFVFVGPRLNLTGQNADEWIPIRAGTEAAVALAMAGVLAANGADAGPYAPLLQAYDPASAAQAAGVEAGVIEDLAERFAARSPSIAVGAGLAGQHRNATASNLAVLVLNAVAGNIGSTVKVQGAGTRAASSAYAEMEAAIRSMAGEGVPGVVMVHAANPAYTLPPSSGFAGAFGRVPFKVVFASSPDETTALADLILPNRHFLEAWGDAGSTEGVYSIRQPVMQPLPQFDTKQAGDVLLSVAARSGSDLGRATFYEHLRSRWQALYAAGAGVPDDTGAFAPASGQMDFEAFWRTALRRGIARTAVADAGPATWRAPDRALTFDAPSLDGDESEFTLVVHPSGRFGDGALNGNRPWLHELPDPVSKMVWHSWVEMHPSAAARLDLRDGDMVRVRSASDAVNDEVEVPVWTYPGIREDTVALAMGGGHEGVGRFGDGQGVNPMRLLPAEAEQPSGGLVMLATRVSIEPTGERYKLASISGSDDQHDRPIAMAVAASSLGAQGEGEEEAGHGPLRELNEAGGFVPVPTEGRAQDFPLEGARHGEYAEWETTPRWAMAIDMDKCTGCSACVVACQSENNVPWVGEEMVRMGRDMHWIRIERFYETVDASHAGPVDVRHLMMICQHCGNAPCEPVCPVFATYHTPEGINTQVYNRCVGTRYCANNCPYKVRVYNWYTFTSTREGPAASPLAYAPEPMNWQYNPDVTVRENGVMEKCSFCVQRIREAQNRATLEGRGVQDGEIVPACQQSCPAEAIVFGNIRDPRSRVAQVAANERSYRVLDELLNTQPGVSYLKKVTFHDVGSGEHE